MIIKLATGTERSLNEIITDASNKDALIEEARTTVLDSFPDIEDDLPENAFSEINYTGPIIVALCAVHHGIDPVATVRQRLDGETRYR